MTVDARLGALAPIVARKLEEAAGLRCAAGTLWAKAENMPPARRFVDVLRGGTVIAEMKRRSPSGGALRGGLDPAALALGYAGAGAAALSVLTDGPDFGGSLDDLVAARDAVSIPVLRKDFTVDPVQIAEARVAGADAVLLIVAVLSDEVLAQCLDAAQRFGVDTIVEVHDETETRRAVAGGATCVGVNNRDLRTLTTDLDTFARLRALIPDGVVCVAESGVRTADDVRRLVGEGADAVLVGETLMRSDDPAALCASLVEAARR
ncbi:MAG TPA: indole-3-glycerol phosphate synthase TrpC [Candidatus Dormibacteraeota bacterium]|jgi:indole-3-glycerol phosphate synthase|nr:indole-3-glycerol phosphate synthase TrpC [Candidatus Dormibacteraeota bacterium]